MYEEPVIQQMDLLSRIELTSEQLNNLEMVDLYSCLEAWVGYSKHQIKYHFNLYECNDTQYFNLKLLKPKISLWPEEDLPPNFPQKLIPKSNTIKVYGATPFKTDTKGGKTGATLDKLEETLDPVKTYFDAFVANNIHTYNNRQRYECQFFERK